MTDKYQTDSLIFSTYLIHQGFECVSIKQDPSDPKYLFVFDISEKDLASHSDSFWSRKADALTFAEAMKALKSRMYQYKNQNIQYGKTE